jgi:hypothetical protein
VRVPIQRAFFARDLRFCAALFCLQAQKLVNRIEHFVHVAEHPIVPESKNSIAARVQKRSAGFIFRQLIRVLTSIEFDDDAPFDRAEVGDVSANRMLTPEFDVPNPAAAKVSPQDSFGIGLFTAQSAGVLLGEFGWLHGGECL